MGKKPKVYWGWVEKINKKPLMLSLKITSIMTGNMKCILIHLDKLKLSINNINSRLMALEEKVKNEWVNH